MKCRKYKIDCELARKQWKVKQLLKAAGIDEETWKRVRAGSDVRPATVGAIAEAFGCEPEDITEDEDA